MAVDISTEHVVSAHQAAELIPSFRENKPTHVSRVVRAIQRGELEGLRYGTQWCTSVEAIQRWGERQAGKAQVVPGADAPVADQTPHVRTPAARARAVAKANADLANMGL